MEIFKKLGIIDPILNSIREESFEKPTEIQTKSIPLVLAGKDVIAGSATGSGKTLVFGAGIIQHCQTGRGIQSLILTPTRELAEQITKALKKFSKYKPLRITSVYGGVSINRQIAELRTVDVVVGTPGRILDHIGRRTINLSKVKILVLDEADRMLDMGFIDDVEKIIRQCPRKRQTLLFSATITREIASLSQKYMQYPTKVSAECYVDPTKLSQIYYDVNEKLKFSLLVHLLKQEKSGLAMVFCNSRKTVDFVSNNLKGTSINAYALHGGLVQQRRNKVISQFHLQKSCSLVCTDVAARGLDIKNVSHIYNYDIPKESKQYIHRIGRTARAGEQGKAINFLSEKDHDNFRRVLRDYSIKIIKEKMPYLEKVRINWTEKPRSFRRSSHKFYHKPHYKSRR